jgi:hypothetical protein
MDPALAAYIRKHEMEKLQEFHAKHEVFVLAFEDNPIKYIGLPRTRQLNEKFTDAVKEMKRTWSTQVWHIDYFKEQIPVQYSMLWLPRFGRYFWYLILSIRERATVDRKNLRVQVQNQLQAICAETQVQAKVSSRMDTPEDIDFHIAAQQMFSKLTEPPAGKRKPSMPEYKSIDESPRETAFNFPQGRVTVQQFRDTHQKNAQFLANDVISFCRFLRQENRQYKYTREEDLPLLALLRYLRIEPDAELALGRESSPIDFQIFRPDGGVLAVEVTQALPKNGHQYRKALVASPFKLPLHERTLHQAGKDTFPDPIIEAISRKHEINYEGNPFLLVSVVGDYTDEDDQTIEQWVHWIEQRSELGRFSKIFLVELARRKIIELFRPQPYKNRNPP